MSIKLTKAQMGTTVPREEVLRDERIGNYLKEAYPSARIDDQAYSDNIAKARRYAQDLGLVSDQHILDIVECCLLLGGSVYQHETFQRIIAHPMWHFEEKCQALREHVIAAHSKEKP